MSFRLNEMSDDLGPHGQLPGLSGQVPTRQRAKIDTPGSKAVLISACKDFLRKLWAISNSKMRVLSLDEAASSCEARAVEIGASLYDFLELFAILTSGAFGILVNTGSGAHDLIPRCSCIHAPNKLCAPIE